jgi:hypothetical protein
MALTKKELSRRRELGAERTKVRHLIEAEMKRVKHNGVSLAKQLRCSSTMISLVLYGKSHSPRVLEGLRSIGVPEHLLFDPYKIEANV